MAAHGPFSLVFNSAIIVYVVNQLEQVWSLKTFTLMLLVSSLLQVMSYWLIWVVSDLVIPRTWTIGAEDST